MLEKWNSGIMGSGMIQFWIDDPATVWRGNKIIMANIPSKANIPLFHHSTNPFSGQIQKSQKTSIVSVDCQNSETYKLGAQRWL